jgi:hypothetical protein
MYICIYIYIYTYIYTYIYKNIYIGIKGTVQEKVSSEMDYFMQQLRSNEEAQKRLLQINAKKMDSLSSDILNLKMPNNTDAIDTAVRNKFIHTYICLCMYIYIYIYLYMYIELFV